MLNRLIAALVAGLFAMFGLKWLRADAGKDAITKDNLKRADASLKAERKRNDVDAQINADPDLAARARSIGLVRPGRK